MGNLEKEARRYRRKAYLQQAILSFARDAGLYAMHAFGPDAYVKFRLFSFDRLKSRHDRRRLQGSFSRLLEKKYLVLEDTSKGKLARLTPEGEMYLRRLERKDYKIPKPKKWDRRFRVVIFDIKEGKKKIRDQLRTTLLQIGFMKLQDSVWVYPYDCEDLINLLKADYSIGREVLYLIVEKIEGDSWVKKYFSLE